MGATSALSEIVQSFVMCNGGLVEVCPVLSCPVHEPTASSLVCVTRIYGQSLMEFTFIARACCLLVNLSKSSHGLSIDVKKQVKVR